MNLIAHLIDHRIEEYETCFFYGYIVKLPVIYIEFPGVVFFLD